jgi:hypothetical protein
MSKMTINRETAAQLRGVRDHVSLCDDSGTVLGYFIPAADRSMYEGVEPPISKEELDRRSREPGPRYTTAEVLERLRRLEQP